MYADFRWGEGGWDIKDKEASKSPPSHIMGRLKNTKVIDPISGLPLLMHHGAQSHFSEFSTKYDGKNYPSIGNLVKGFYFTPIKEEASAYSEIGGKEEIIISAWLNIENPIYRHNIHKIKLKDEDGEITGALRRLGYDGYINADSFGSIVEAAVWDNSQIFRHDS